MSEDARCLQCDESQEFIKWSQGARCPIRCVAEDYYGEIIAVYPRHRFVARTKKDAAQ